MSTITATHGPDPRFEFDLADRLRRALRVSGVGVQEMADYLEVSRDTVGNWINGRARPRTRDLRAFALRTNYPLRWLSDGYPEPDSNWQPTDYKAVGSSKGRFRANRRPPLRADASRPNLSRR